MNQKLRHLLYYLFVAVVFVPHLTCYLAAKLYEVLDELISNVQYRCFREKYARLRER